MENSASKTVNSDTFQTVVNEERFQNLTNELRCLVCQNQTIAESNATLAVDLKKQVAKQITKERVTGNPSIHGRALRRIRIVQSSRFCRKFFTLVGPIYRTCYCVFVLLLHLSVKINRKNILTAY